jgi:dihydroflavonol-4-reductase
VGLIAVTGATGHIGGCVVRELVARGENVRVLVRGDDPESLRGLDVERVRGDVRDGESLERAFSGVEIVYHLAAVISIVGEMGGIVHETNVVGARNAGRAALVCGVRRMVHFCSVHAFDPRPFDGPVDETRPRVHSRSAPAYDRSKAGGEAEIRRLVADGLDAVIVHPTGVIGPFDYAPSRMGKVFLDLFFRRLPSGVGGGFDWVDVRDVARSAIFAAERGRTNESYLLSGHWLSVADLSRIAEVLTGSRVPRLCAPMWLARAAAPFAEGWARLTGQEPLLTSESLLALRAYRHCVREKAERELGHAPRPTAESVRDTYKWFAEHGRIPRDILDRVEEASEGLGL